MARGTQLLKLTEMVRNEVGRATNIAVGIDDVPEIKQKLRRQQELFYDDWDWSHLRQIFPVKTLQAGEQYYDFPDGFNLDRLEDIVLWYSGLPRPIPRGIGFAEYAIYNSTLATPVRSDPAQRWDVRWTGTKEQMEIWPVPSSNTQLVQIKGIRQLRALIADNDVADLDDQLLVLTVAAEMLGKQGNENAKMVAGLAQRRFESVKGRMNGGAQEHHRLGMGAADRDTNRTRIVVSAR